MSLSLSVIIPTKNEQDNIKRLVIDLQRALQGVTCEILFVDASTDLTLDRIIEAAFLCATPDFQIHYFVSQADLANAVIEGISLARAPLVVVIDADLQHPPELVRQLYDHQQQAYCGVDVVIATRYSPQGSARGLANAWRHAGSRAAAILAHLLFPRRLHKVSDPLTGCFLIRRELVPWQELRPIGYKIFLEIFMRLEGHFTWCEMAYVFQGRYTGTSKFSRKQVALYLRHLGRLVQDFYPWRQFQFAAVGAYTLVLGQALLWFLSSETKLPLQVDYALQAIMSIEMNFYLNFIITWHNRQAAWIPAWARFHLARIPTVLFNQVLFALLVLLHMPVMAASLICIILILALNYYNNDKFVFKEAPHDPVGERDRPRQEQSGDDRQDTAILIRADLSRPH